MAVLVEAISVIVRLDRLMPAVGDDWNRFKALVPNATLCSDNEIARVGFMHPDDVGSFIAELEALGLRYLVNGEAQDLVVADQQTGLLARCDWAETGSIPWEGDSACLIMACRLKGSDGKRVFTPEWWTYEDSLSAKFRFIPTGHADDAQLIEDDEGLQVYQRPDTAKQEYVGRVRRYALARAKSKKQGLWARLSGLGRRN